MKLSMTKLQSLFLALGFETADKWDAKKMASKIEKLPSLAQGDAEIPDEEDKKFLDKILKAVEAEEELEIEDDTEEEEEEGAEEAEGEEEEEAADEDGEEEEKPAKKKSKKDKKEKGEKKEKKAKKSKEPKGPGVIATIVECLTAASEKKPASKEHMLKVLVKRFPDRSEDGMKSTINIQVPGRLANEKDLKIKKNDKGYWISSGKKKEKVEAE